MENDCFREIPELFAIINFEFLILNLMKENIVKEKSFAFALTFIEVYKLLISKNLYVLSKQFL